MPGATLLDLARLTGSSIAQISWMFTGRSLGGILGAVALPIITCRFHCWAPLGVSQVLQGALCCVVPICQTNTQMIAIYFFIGTTRSFIDAGEYNEALGTHH